MRLLIPYKFNKDNNGLELKYAIRSIEKHFKLLSGVTLIGDYPDWFTGRVIEFEDIPKKKELNMMLKILCADEQGDFLYSNDDFFALEDFDQTLPNYYDMSCFEMWQKHKVPKYRAMYANCQNDWPNYDIHCPMIMNGPRFKTQYFQMTEQLPIKTMYAHDLKGEYMSDCKIQGEHTEDEIIFKIKRRKFFSTKENAINADMIKILNTLYPNASSYERR